jgi:hypothetical protein
MMNIQGAPRTAAAGELAGELSQCIGMLRQMNKLVLPDDDASVQSPVMSAASPMGNWQRSIAGDGNAETESRPGASSAEAASVPASVPGYEILEELGRGGMGVVPATAM